MMNLAFFTDCTILTGCCYEKITTVINLSDLNMQKDSTLYHSLTFLGNFCNSGKLSVLKQQHVYLQNKHGKGYP